MARMTARDRLNAFISESTNTREAAAAFVNAAYAKNQSHSYAAGYLESFAVELIMQLPKAKREEYRAQLAKAAQNVTVD